MANKGATIMANKVEANTGLAGFEAASFEEATAAEAGPKAFSVTRESGIASILYNPTTGQLACILDASHPSVVASKSSRGNSGVMLAVNGAKVPGLGTVSVKGWWSIQRGNVGARDAGGAIKVKGR